MNDSQPSATAAPESPPPSTKGRWAALGGLALILWKFKGVVLFALSKAKLLLLGLTKAKTLFSMLLSLGFYWSVWGWPFALGFVLSIYVHEMGHVAALRRYGIAAGAPMFVPFVGAFVRLKQAPRTPHEDAMVGLAGPVYGLGAAVVCAGLYWITDISLIGAVARSGAWINLFNLIPVWQLDGGRGFRAMDKNQRWFIFAIMALAWLWSGEGMLLFLMLGAGYRIFATPSAEEPNNAVTWLFAGLIVALAAVSQIELPELARGR